MSARRPDSSFESGLVFLDRWLQLRLDATQKSVNAQLIAVVTDFLEEVARFLLEHAVGWLRKDAASASKEPGYVAFKAGAWDKLAAFLSAALRMEAPLGDVRRALSCFTNEAVNLDKRWASMLSSCRSKVAGEVEELDSRMVPRHTSAHDARAQIAQGTEPA